MAIYTFVYRSWAIRVLCAVGMVTMVAAALLQQGAATPLKGGAGALGGASPVYAARAFGKLPLAFEVNRGQTDKHVRFLAHGLGSSLFLTDAGAVMAFQGSRSEGSALQATTRKAKIEIRGAAVALHFAGANPHAAIVGLDRLPGRVNYFIGGAHRTVRTNIPTFARVEYRNVYPGVDIEFYGHQERLEYDVVVHRDYSTWTPG